MDAQFEAGRALGQSRLELEIDERTNLPLRSRGVLVDEQGAVLYAQPWTYPAGETEATYREYMATRPEPARGVPIPARA